MRVENRGNAHLSFPVGVSCLVLERGANIVDVKLWAQACERFRGRADGPEALIEAGVLVIAEGENRPATVTGIPITPNASDEAVNAKMRLLKWGAELTPPQTPLTAPSPGR